MIYCLGPAGSYTGKATKIFSKSINDDDIIYCDSIYEVFEYVDKYKDIDYVLGLNGLKNILTERGDNHDLHSSNW